MRLGSLILFVDTDIEEAATWCRRRSNSVFYVKIQNRNIRFRSIGFCEMEHRQESLPVPANEQRPSKGVEVHSRKN